MVEVGSNSAGGCCLGALLIGYRSLKDPRWLFGERVVEVRGPRRIPTAQRISLGACGGLLGWLQRPH